MSIQHLIGVHRKNSNTKTILYTSIQLNIYADAPISQLQSAVTKAFLRKPVAVNADMYENFHTVLTHSFHFRFF
jgi:hypothetical protein